MAIKGLKVKLYSDGANINDMLAAHKAGVVDGFTTNPTLMRKAGISDYESFAKEVLKAITDRPISFEVFSDDIESMEREARKIWSWGKNINIKIPYCNTKGEPTTALVKKLSAEGFSLNITALFTPKQVKEISDAISSKSQTIISVFAGRIADTGVDPEPIMKECAAILSSNPNAQLLWASSRELINIFQADKCGCHIITATPDILKKVALIGMTLEAMTLDTVNMFYNDAKSAGYKI